MDCLTPGMILALLDVVDELPRSLTTMFSSGEALPLSTARAFLEKWPHCALENILSCTETSADISFCKITSQVTDSNRLLAPMADHRVCWENTMEVRDGALVITGFNIPDGYLTPCAQGCFSKTPDGRNVLASGDMAEWEEMADGTRLLWCNGRRDFNVKVRGHRVDLSGVEAVLEDCEKLRDVAVFCAKENIWVFVVTDDLPAVQAYALEQVPLFHLLMWRQLKSLPYTATGKRDRVACKMMLDTPTELPGGEPRADEREVADIWAEVLGRPVGREENFMHAGGHSLLAMKLAKKVGLSSPVEALGCHSCVLHRAPGLPALSLFSVVVEPCFGRRHGQVFAYPTVASMVAYLAPKTATAPGDPKQRSVTLDSSVAIVGMSGRFPGAPSTGALWDALRDGKDLLTTVSKEPARVPKKGLVPDSGIDSSFWGVPLEQASMMDTAQRMLLEVAYEALEDAGLDPLKVSGRVGVVVCGGSLQHYATERLGLDVEQMRSERPDDYFALEIGTDKDYLATSISYRLNLTGPSEVVQTACSSSLVAVVRAVQMLRLGLCDYVLCGGASFSPDGAVRQVDGMIWSPDGVCRPFADDANGTVNADGCGLVLLTRLEAAQARRQRVYANICGAAVNNDGSRKAGFSAPSFQGQVEVIRMAHADANISGDDVDYIEAHGTGTRLGDPLEVQALAEALSTKRTILLGSVKGNLGHMNTAAAIPGYLCCVLWTGFGSLMDRVLQQPSLWCSSRFASSRVCLRVDVVIFGVLNVLWVIGNGPWFSGAMSVAADGLRLVCQFGLHVWGFLCLVSDMSRRSANQRTLVNIPRLGRTYVADEHQMVMTMRVLSANM